MKDRMTKVSYALLTLALVGLVATDAAAQRRRGGARQPRGRAAAAAPAAPREAPMSDKIAESMGDLSWGMSKADVLNYFRRQIQERYRPIIAKATDAITEDRLRADMGDELRRLRESEVCFRGNRTGWDISFIRDEFAHNSNECMIVYRDQNSQNFYFFSNDKLWKWYKAFDASVFQGQTFEQFSVAIQARFGPAREAQGELVPGAGQRQWLEWQDAQTRLRAIDQTRFYGFYCLVFEDKATLARLSELRRNAPARSEGRHALVDAVTSGGGEVEASANPDIVDRITGQIRNRSDAPAQQQGQGGHPGAQGRGGSSTPAPSQRPNPSDDPLRGMDL
jgi:hypothetical protein